MTRFLETQGTVLFRSVHQFTSIFTRFLLKPRASRVGSDEGSWSPHAPDPFICCPRGSQVTWKRSERGQLDRLWEHSNRCFAVAFDDVHHERRVPTVNQGRNRFQTLTLIVYESKYYSTLGSDYTKRLANLRTRNSASLSTQHTPVTRCWLIICLFNG